jgi:tRNA/rRNA methyltransferase
MLTFFEQINVVLARTFHPGNIGSAARAIKTMGLNNLILVEPANFPSPEATSLAASASDILQSAKVYQDLPSAIANSSLVYGFSARNRELNMQTISIKQACLEWLKALQLGHTISWVFGNETNGLSIKELTYCNRVVNIPVHPDYTSLNLAQAVQIAAYEHFSTCLLGSNNKIPTENLFPLLSENLASRAAHDALYHNLKEQFTKIGLLDRKENPDRFMRHLQLIFDKASLSQDELDILQGLFKVLTKQKLNI